MKRLLGVVVALSFALGCSQPTGTNSGDLASPQSLALSGKELFVASTDADELKVLELTGDPTTTGFLRAPNPLYVLSIPVAPRPVALAVDTDGTHPGGYVFSLSAVTQRLSVIDVAKKTEVAEVALPGTPLALDARTLPGGGARVYVGLSNGRRGLIATVDVPAPANLDPAALVAVNALDLGTAAPAALAVSPDGATLAVGDRLGDETSPDPAAQRPGLILVDLASGTPVRVPVGGPVNRLVYSPAAIDSSGTSYAAGEFLYAIIAGGGCGLGQSCGGVQVIQNGQALQQAPGVMAEPIRLPGIPTDIAVASSATQANPVVLNLPASVGGLTPVPLLLAIPCSDGLVYFASGTAARIFNIAAASTSAGSIAHFEPDGTVSAGPDGGGPIAPVLAQGALGDEQITIVDEGQLPALIDRPASIDAAGLLTDIEADFASLGVRDGDEVELSGGASTCPPRATVAPGGTAILHQLQLDATFDPTCYPGAPSAGRYSVRAMGAEPYVVAGSATGFLGRTAPGEAFASPARYFFRPPGYDGTKPGLQFTMGIGDARRGAGWGFVVTSGVEGMSVSGGANAILPAAAIWAPDVSEFFVAFPGGASVSQLSIINPGTVLPQSNANVQVIQ